LLLEPWEDKLNNNRLAVQTGAVVIRYSFQKNLSGCLISHANIAFLVVDFFGLFVAHEEDGSSEEEDSSTPSHSIGLNGKMTAQIKIICFIPT
jgi:hypothetical protein